MTLMRVTTVSGANSFYVRVFSNRVGCLGSLAVSIISTIVLIALMRGCSGPHW